MYVNLAGESSGGRGESRQEKRVQDQKSIGKEDRDQNMGEQIKISERTTHKKLFMNIIIQLPSPGCRPPGQTTEFNLIVTFSWWNPQW